LPRLQPSSRAAPASRSGKKQHAENGQRYFTEELFTLIDKKWSTKNDRVKLNLDNVTVNRPVQITPGESVSERNPDGLGYLHQLALGIHRFQLSDGLGNVHGFDALIAQTHLPNPAWAIRSPAATPKRVPRMRSKGVGEPPRWMCPSTLTRASLLAAMAMAFPVRLPTEPARRFSLKARGTLTPSATTTIVKRWP